MGTKLKELLDTPLSGNEVIEIVESLLPLKFVEEALAHSSLIFESSKKEYEFNYGIRTDKTLGKLIKAIYNAGVLIGEPLAEGAQ